jgi:hypothetical protein
MKEKIKNIFGSFSGYVGYVSLFTLFVIMIVLVISGFYGWQKYQEIKFPDKAARGEIKGPSYYLNGIKDQIGQALEKKDIKNKRAMELAEPTKIVSDKANLISFEIPKSWTISASEGSRGVQISRLVADNSYFSKSADDKSTIINAGAELTIQITRGENRTGFEGNGGHADIQITRNNIDVNGKENIYHLFGEAGYPGADILDDHIVYNGNTYLFRLVYNPQTFSDAEYTFQEILNSIQFK